MYPSMILMMSDIHTILQFSRTKVRPHVWINFAIYFLRHIAISQSEMYIQSPNVNVYFLCLPSIQMDCHVFLCILYKVGANWSKNCVSSLEYNFMCLYNLCSLIRLWADSWHFDRYRSCTHYPGNAEASGFWDPIERAGIETSSFDVYWRF